MGEKAEDHGLDKPVVVVTLKSGGKDDKSVREEVVLLSAPDDEGKVFALRKQDGAVMELGPETARALMPDATLIKSRSVLTLDKADLATIRIDAGEIKQRVSQDETQTFTLQEPKGLSHDGRIVSDLVTSLISLTAERWVSDEADGSFGLARPSAVVTLDVGAKDGGVMTRKLTLGGPAPGGVYASLDGDPGVFILNKRVDETVKTWFIDRSYLMVDTSEVVTLKLERGERTLELRKDGDRFLQFGEGARLEGDAISTVVGALKVMLTEAAAHLGPARPIEGLAQPSLVVRVERVQARGERSKPVVLRFGAGDSWRDTSIFYARRDGIDVTFVVARSRLQRILDVF